jgi:phosphoribosylaminoimidazole-succinocarboxamide synthase
MTDMTERSGKNMASETVRLYEGKAKYLTESGRPDTYLMHFKDDATAFNGQKRAQIERKGVLNAAISARFFEILGRRGVPTHFVRQVDDDTLEVLRLRMIPLEVVVRNVVAGSLAKRLGLEEGRELAEPVVELYYKDDALGDPLVNDDHVRLLGVASPEEVARLRQIARQVDAVLRPYLAERALILVDFKLEFGRRESGEILLGDEISPDTCRFWDATSRERLDKDRFRRDLGGVRDAYEEVLRRLTAHGD